MQNSCSLIEKTQMNKYEKHHQDFPTTEFHLQQVLYFIQYSIIQSLKVGDPIYSLQIGLAHFK